jgi:hypothetical protein
MAVFLKRDTNIYISKDPNASADATNTVQLKVRDFSYSKDSRLDAVGRNTLDPTQTRTLAPYISAISPVRFTFVTYVLPLVDTNVTSPEEYLWVSLMGVDSLTSNSTSSTIDFANGNVATLRNLTLWFDQPNQSEGNYRLDNAVVDSAEISFDINSIAQIRWSGQALNITEDNTPPASTDRTTANNFLKNKLSTIALTMNSVGYILALTGGNINFSNNTIFYGRNILGKTTVPVGHYTGNRRISGSLAFYMKTGTNETVDLFNAINTNIATDTYESTHLANITINVGGSIDPSLQLNIPQTLLQIPRQVFTDVISLDIRFVAKEESGNYSTVIYNMP